MKKNLFLLFSIYFFVIQPLIIGVLWGQANFFWLGAINLVAIILIGILSTTREWTSHEEHRDHEKPVREAKVSFHEQFRWVVKEHKKKSELAMPSIISFLVAVIIFFMFLYNSGAVEVMLLFALILGFIVFMSLTLIFKHRITKSFRALLGTKVYFILMIVSLVLTGYDYYQVHKEYQTNFSDYIAQNFLGQEMIPTDGYVYTGEWTILGSGLWNTDLNQDISSDMFSGTNSVTDIQEETGTVIESSAVENEIIPTSQSKQKIMDAILYLIQKYNIPLVTKQDINFTYVTTKNPYYTERRTAYANKMIGKTTNPSKYIVCESYIVMKWLLEKRPVTYTASTVLTKFRTEAIKRDALNGCKKWYIVDATNL